MAEAVSQTNEPYSISNNLEIFSLIWLDDKTNSNEAVENIKSSVRTIINHLITFQNEETCQQYIEKRPEEDRLILIINDSFSYTLVPRIHQLRQVYAIYIHCKNTLANEEWIIKFTKIKAATIKFDELIAQIRLDQKKRMKDEQPLLINIFSTSENAGKSTTGLNGQFVYNQLLIDCLLRMRPSTEQDKNELISICKREYQGNSRFLNQLEEFQNDYSPKKVLWWYTRDSFFYKILNKALRVQNIEILFLFRSYISDIYHQLQYYQFKTPIRIYRSQLMAKEEIYSLKRNINQYISVNSFLSTTVQRETALFFMGEGNPEGNLQRVLFEIDADPSVVSMKPFADITSHSDFPIETEVLFMLGSIFRLNNVVLEDDQLWVITMTLYSDNEHDLKQLLSHMKDQNGNGKADLSTLAKIVWKMGKFNLAEKYYLRLINEIPSNDPILIKLYEDLGDITSHKGDYDASIQWYNKALEIREKNPSFNIEKNTKIGDVFEFIDYRNPKLEKIIKQSYSRSRIDLSEQKLVDSEMKIVVKEAIIKKQCTKLYLTDNPITAKGAFILASGLKNNSTLQSLNLSDTRIGDSGIQCIADALSTNNNIIRALIITNIGLTDKGAEDLAVMLKRNKTLIYLSLSANELGDEGIAILSNAVQNHNNTLEFLDLSYIKWMTELSLEFLVLMLTYTQALKVLNIYSRNLSIKNENRLKKVAQANKKTRITVNDSWIALKYAFSYA
ncbi:unnamed protein product [Adineta steineri]|uniref:Tetratricopeptide repeat protein n=1 Tax=Adineta steineri TaxID=433720 RepID=A0A819SUM5_9BILA|nr:unnamed protein product [Adineta steineri]CAF4065063.1 unnamed protein product [Adineta steineri]